MPADGVFAFASDCGAKDDSDVSEKKNVVSILNFQIENSMEEKKDSTRTFSRFFCALPSSFPARIRGSFLGRNGFVDSH